ncbi:BTB/POZ and MATH domain-containing protein 2-like [Panicum miliaceum]|uniref:BTB/POZ and MATH domain-containing protein 2-like n=1 Tax=Panicum miliaceum TaxID=4540 RepID=A0A3L6PPP1_PANMI|nr:BTB/POZ and MATH domain-containing protein 2-like [Panicum miliaceum]
MASSSQGPVSTTASTCAAETARGRHTFVVAGYNLHRGLGAGKFIRSATFYVGGHGWSVRCYPDGHTSKESNQDFVCAYLELMAGTGAAEVRAVSDLRLVDQLTGESKVLFHPAAPRAFSGESPVWSARWFIRRTELEASTYLREDRIVIECNVTVIVTKQEAEPQTPCEIIPEEGADVAFKVQEETFRAHRVVLAARSPVFKAELCGPLRERNDGGVIPVEDVHPGAFRALLHFIYTDSLPAMDDLDGDENREIVKHLLVAADRYAMERMKLVCASILSRRLDVESVSTTLALADRYSCGKLKDACIQYIISSNSMDEVVASPGYEELKRACPVATVELWEKASKSRKIVHAEQLERVLDQTD